MSDDLRTEIRDRYGAAARAAGEAGKGAKAAPAAGRASCCGAAGASCCDTGATAPAGGQLLEDASRLYDDDELAEVPLEARLASLGCGNPVALAGLRPGEVVLDLGSGGGIDVLLSARRVGPGGKAYGLDMTDDMLALAERNRRQAGATNVEFLKGDLESIPLPDSSVDVVISNCVVNLTTDKDAALREAYRVLRPGGRFAVSDIVFEGEAGLVPDAVRRRVEAWAACIAGAMGDGEYRERLRAAGFTDVGLEVTRVYDPAAEGGVCGCEGIELPDGVRLVSAFVRAVKPA
jgi:SAM-dependent methyltransferase